MMSPDEQQAVLAILVHAALADGEKSDAERTALRRMAEALPAGGLNPWVTYQAVLAGQLPVEQAARQLTSREARLLAYEMAVGVCDTDGAPNASEEAFLSRLRNALDLGGPAAPTRAADDAAQEIAAALPAAVTPSPNSDAGPAGSAAIRLPAVDTAAQEKRVLQYAVLTGALELLPQSLATMAVVPLQMKLVYSIGKDFGYTLDRGHIREFMGAAGAGLAAQAVEGYARKLIGGLVGGMLGKDMIGGLGRGVASTGTGAALTFGATYAIGHLAIRYYGAGRAMSLAAVKDVYAKLLADGRSLFSQNRGAVEQRASTLSPSEIINLVRQG